MNTTNRISHERMRDVLVVFTAIVAALGVVGVIPAVFLPDMFGPLTAHGDVLTTAAVFAVMAFPPVCALSVIGAWLLWKRRRDMAACTAMVLPPLCGLLVLIVLLWLSY